MKINKFSKEQKKVNRNYQKQVLIHIILLFILIGAYFSTLNLRVSSVFLVLFVVCVLILAIRFISLLKFLYKLMKDKEELEDTVKANKVFICEQIVSMLLNGRKIDSSFSKLLEEFEGKVTCVSVLCGSKQFDKEQYSLIKNTIQCGFERISDVYFTPFEASSHISFMIKLHDGTEKAALEYVSKETVKALAENHYINADVVYGRITGNLSDVPIIYREVNDAAFICVRDGNVIDAEKLSERRCNAYSYSVDTEINIIIYIKKGDFSRAYGMIRNVLDEFLYQRSFPIYIIRCFMFEIAGTILKAIGETEKENSNIALNISDSLKGIFFTESVIEMELIIKDFLKEVCECISRNNKGVASPFCEKVKQYVRENFADPNMNVNAIAARFYINPAYLSNMFKRNTDIKLLDFINRVRVDAAKKMMLENPKITIEELSEKAGFTNSRTFRRIFLKYEDMSPSKFAKM